MDSTETCKICENPLKWDVESVTNVKIAGIKTLLTSSKLRSDNIFTEENTSGLQSIFLHLSCQLKYNKSRNIQKVTNCNKIENNISNSISLRSKETYFEFKTHCLFCGDKACEILEKRYPVSRRRKILKCEKIESVNIIRSRALETDNQDVIRRLGSVIDLVAVNGKYHEACYKKFMFSDMPRAAGRPEKACKNNAFKNLCDFLDANDECQYTLQELWLKMQELSGTSDVYGVYYLSKKLKEYYKENIFIKEENGKPSIVCLRRAFTKILQEKWYSEKTNNEQDERLRFIRAAVAIVSEDIRSTYNDVENYDQSDNIDIAKNIESLKILIEGIIVGRNISSDLDLKIISICHSILSAARPISFLSNLHVLLSVWMHKKFGSRQLVEMLSKLGYCASYNEALRFENSSSKLSTVKSNDEGLLQFVFDNADINQRTLTGKGTFHCLGGIMCATPITSVKREQRIPRKTIESDKEKSNSIDIVNYTKFGKKGLQKICYQEIEFSHCALKLRNFILIDTISMTGSWLQINPRPGWNGFMQVSTSNIDTYDTSEIIYLPFIRLSATDPSAIYSSLMYSRRECDRQKQKCCIVTYDQPLYMLAMEIITATKDTTNELDIIVRLGGFHILMSYLGAIGFIMSGSGLEEMWKCVYAEISIQHMMSGKAVARAIRAHFITCQALVTNILKTAPEQIKSKKHEARVVYDKVLKSEIAHSEASESDILVNIYKFITEYLSSAASASRTSLLWMNYYELIVILRLYIRAERTGDWNLHLYCVKKMIPIFAATGHNNYARSSQLYLQHMIGLESKMEKHEFVKFTTKGYFTIRRSSKFWCGVWSDMTIEQCLMRAMKITGGLSHGRGLSNSVLNRWISSMPSCVAYANKLEEITGKHNQSSEQHVDLQKSRQAYDERDLTSFATFLDNHSPFNPRTKELKSIFSGPLANKTTNCDKSEIIGTQIMEKFCGKDFSNIHFKRADRVSPLSAVNRAIAIKGNLEPINEMQIFERIIQLRLDESDLIACMAYELSFTCTSLFNEMCEMRTGTKSSLQNIILRKLKKDETHILPTETHYVLDGGFLLHKVRWNLLCTLAEAVESYIKYITSKYGLNVTVVFDGYSDEPTTKNSAHSNRYKKSKSDEVYLLNEDTVIQTSQRDFLSCWQNINRLIRALSEKLHLISINTLTAAHDADTLTARTAIELAHNATFVAVVSSDTDLLVHLVAHTPPNYNIVMISPSQGKIEDKFFNISEVQRVFGAPQKCILFLHAMSGCDTTSAPFRKGKKQALDLILSDIDMQDIALSYCEPDANVTDIVKGGEKFLLSLYKSSASSLDLARYIAFIESSNNKFKCKLELASFPPTCAAAEQHSMRTYHQVQEWLGNKCDATSWGWKVVDNKFAPVISLQTLVPDNVLQLLHCSCTSNCSTTKCTCRKNRLNCSSSCRNCRGIDCANNEPDTSENQIYDIDDVNIESDLRRPETENEDKLISNDVDDLTCNNSNIGDDTVSTKTSVNNILRRKHKDNTKKNERNFKRRCTR